MSRLTSDAVLTLLTGHGVSGHAALTKWLSVAKAESSLDPSVINSIGATGLFQILQPVHVKAHPDWSKAYLQDASNNVAAAQVVSNNWTNITPWVSSTLGQIAATPASSLEVTNFLQNPALKAANAAVPAAAPTINALANTAQVATNAYSTITNPHNWLRLAYGLVGAALIYAGAITIVKGSVTNQLTQLVSGAMKGKAS